MTETDFLLLIQTYRTDTFDALMYHLSAAGNGGLMWLILAALLVVFDKTRKTGLAIFLAMLLHFIVINLWLKPFFDRLRPCENIALDNLLLQCLHDGSFPSGHTSASFATAAIIFCAHKPAGLILFFLAALMGFSRLYLFVHYPSDVLAGALLGILFGMSAYRLAKR